MQLQDDSLRHL